MANQDASSPENENHLIAERRAKLTARRELAAEQGRSAFPNDFRRDSLTVELQDLLGDKDKAELETLDHQASVAGRVMRQRGPFIVIQD